MKKILLTFILLVALIFTMARASAQSENDGIITTTPDPFLVDSDAGIIAAKFVKQIDILNKVALDDSILTAPAFVILEDRSKPIPEEESGRPNPFAPL